MTNKFDDPTKNNDNVKWLSGRFVCPICLYTGGYVFPDTEYWLECPKCGEESHTNECIIEYWGKQDSDDESVL